MKQINKGSSYWLRDDIDTSFKRDNAERGRKLDFTKLASTQRAIGNFVNIVTGKQVPIKFNSSDQSYTDGQSVTIGTDLAGQSFDPAVGLALHEGSHIAFTDFKLLDNYLSSGSKFRRIALNLGCGDTTNNIPYSHINYIKDILNWIEDRRIDFHVYTTAPGYRVYYEAMYDKYFNDKIIDKALTQNAKTQETWDDYFFHLINLTNPNRNLNALKGMRSIWNVIDLSNIKRLKNTEDALFLSCEIYKIMRDAINAASQSEVKNDDEEDVDDSTSDGLGTDSNPSSGDVSIDELVPEEKEEASESIEEAESKEEGEPKVELTQREADRLQKAVSKQRDFVSNAVKKRGRLTKNDVRVVSALKNSGTESRTINVGGGESGDVMLDTIVIKKLTPAVMMTIGDLFELSQTKKYFEAGIEPTAWRYKATKTAVEAGLILGKQLGKKLQLRTEERSLKNTRLLTGKIDRRLVSSLGYNNEAVFHRIMTDQYKKFFIHISIDASGSMTGQQFYDAIKSAVAIAKAASMTTGIRVQITTRGTSHRNGNISTVLYCYDSAVDKMSKIRTMFPFLDTYGMTPEGIAFESIYRDIKRDAKGDECIFVNYSDGMPGGVGGVAYGMDGIEYTRKVVNKMKSIGIDIISFFVTNRNSYSDTNDKFKRMYGPDAEFVDSTSLIKIAYTLNKKFLEKSETV